MRVSYEQFDRERQTKGKDDSIKSSSASSKVAAPKVLKCMAKTTWRGSPFPSLSGGFSHQRAFISITLWKGLKVC